VGIQDKPVKGLFASALAGKQEQHAEQELTHLAQTCAALDLAIQKRGSLKTCKALVRPRAVDDASGSLEMFAVLANLAEGVRGTDEAAAQSLQTAFSLLNKNLQDQDMQDTYVRNRLLTGQRECLSALDDLNLLLKTAATRSQQRPARRALASHVEPDFLHDSSAPGPDLMGILLAASRLDGDDDSGNPPEGSGRLVGVPSDGLQGEPCLAPPRPEEEEAKVQLFEGLLANASLLD